MIFHELSSLDGDASWALFLDTSTHNGQMMAFNKTQVLFDSTWGSEAKHDQVLNQNFDELIKTLDLQNLKYIVCSLGPGSFTGLRVSATFSKVLSLSLNSIPIYGVSSFYAVAFTLIEKNIVKKKENFSVFIPSIGKKFFRSDFIFNPNSNIHEEKIDFSGAIEQAMDLDSKSISTNTAYEDITQLRHKSLRSDSALLPYVKRFSYLDFYPLFLRRSEAEEKLR